MTRDNVIKGLQILEKYDPGGYCSVYDDTLLGATPSKVSEEDKKALEDLGWFIEKESDSWAAFI